MFDPWRGFADEKLSTEWIDKLTDMARIARGDILKMTTVAGSGHPGGSMSSIDIYLVLYNMARVNPADPTCDDRDRIVVSHGHTSPGVYSALGHAGFFDVLPALHGFRQGGSPFEGHVERSVPGVEWDTGNLGQGLAVGVGKAIYGKLSGKPFHTFVVMGDGEQQKGQIGESRRHVVKFGLNSVTAIIDYNGLQISGKLDDVMPQNIKGEWEADGWKVVEIDGHDFNQIYSAVRTASQDDTRPYMILANTVMGKGVSFMENDEGFHGAPVKMDKIGQALSELGVGNNIDELKTRRTHGVPPQFEEKPSTFPKVESGTPITYAVGETLDNRGAWGKALSSLAEDNMDRDGFVAGVFDCDLSGSVKTKAFGDKYPDSFFQCGITEHAVAVTAGALSSENALSIWAAFGAFGVDETYNQARLNDINHANVKLFCTHSGVNVGEDGKTHQCIDYFGLFNSTFGWKVITPADPNQTDRIARHVLTRPGNFAVIMGRSKLAVVADENGKPLFGGEYNYEYGRMDIVRRGERLVLVTAGNMLPDALGAWNLLANDGMKIGLVSVSDWSDLHADDLAMLADYGHIVTLEDHNVKTGLGTALSSALFEAGHGARFTKLGVTNYASSGKPHDLYQMLGLDAESVADRIREMLGAVKQQVES